MVLLMPSGLMHGEVHRAPFRHKWGEDSEDDGTRTGVTLAEIMKATSFPQRARIRYHRGREVWLHIASAPNESSDRVYQVKEWPSVMDFRASAPPPFV